MIILDFPCVGIKPCLWHRTKWSNSPRSTRWAPAVALSSANTERHGAPGRFWQHTMGGTQWNVEYDFWGKKQQREISDHNIYDSHWFTRDWKWIKNGLLILLTPKKKRWSPPSWFFRARPARPCSPAMTEGWLKDGHDHFTMFKTHKRPRVEIHGKKQRVTSSVTVPLILCVLTTSILLFRHISTTHMGLSLTMDFSPCWNALRFTALCGHFMLFSMAFTRQCAKQPKKKHGSQEYVRISWRFRPTGKNITTYHNVISHDRGRTKPRRDFPGAGKNFCKTSAKNVRIRTIWVKQTCLYYDNHIYDHICIYYIQLHIRIYTELSENGGTPSYHPY